MDDDAISDYVSTRFSLTIEPNDARNGVNSVRWSKVSDRIFVTVDGREELAEIDPSFDQVAARYPLTGCKGSHGLLIDSENRLAFAACEENSKLVVFDLQSKKATATLTRR
jgi:hypothetical protein